LSRKTYQILTAIFLFVLVFSISFTQASAKPGKLNSSTAKWTFMVYMDADNNLDPFANIDMEEMMKIGSTKDVNIIVLCDRLEEPAYIYKIEKGKCVLPEGSPINGIEVDMGDPEIVETFLNYVIENFPAEHYFLDIWNHGNDFVGSCVDENTGTGERGYLYHYELVEALQSVYDKTEVMIDILSFDACLQGMIEVAYYYKDLVSYLVGSEGYVALEGYPYDEILEQLVNSPDIDADAFAKIVVDEYVGYYVKENMAATRGSFPTLSAIDLEKLDQLVENLSRFLRTLERDINSYLGAITAGRGKGILPWAEYGWEAYIDLYTFVETVGISSQNDKLRNIAEALLNSIESAVYANSSLQLEEMSVHGLGIYFPSSESAMYHNPLLDGEYYAEVPFATETEWLNFLSMYYSHCS